MPTFYLAWVNEGVTFGAGTHATTATKIWDGAEGGEIVFSLEIEQSEGEFPSLRIEVKNPRVGLLAAGRNLWCWLSWDNGGGVEPLLNGRLVGIPQRMTGEVVSLEFVARPADYFVQKDAVAAILRVLPWYDPVWLQEGVNDADTVLETRTARWHIDRLTLVVTASDIITGEAGQIEVGAADHFYDEFEVSYGEPPLRRVAVSGTVSWPQTGSGDVDLTRPLHDAFRAQDNPYEYPVIASMTGDGLLSDWPEPLSDIGGGWSIAASSSIAPATWLQEKAYVVQYVDKTEDADTQFQDTATVDEATLFNTEWTNWEAAFQLTAYLVSLIVHYDAERERSETVTATVEADAQPLLVDPSAAEEETIELASTFVGEPVDPDTGSPIGGEMPIGDLRRNAYFKTDRGAQSFEYLLLLARAKLMARSRAVEIRFVTTWAIASSITCRHSVRLIDPRLPGGEAIGKVIAYTLSASGEDEIRAEVTIGCAIGYGVALGAVAAGTPTYVQDGYVEDGYQQRTGAETALIAGELHYQSFDDLEITDDDGVDLFDMTSRTVLNSLTVTGAPGEQKAAIDASAVSSVPDPVGALRDTPTVITLDLKPVAGGAFHVDYAPEVSMLVVPMTIDLEAA